MQRLAGKVAIVTGATRGIGLAISSAFLREGARVVVAGRSESSANKARDALGSQATAGFAGDLSDPEVPGKLVRAAMEAFGALHILVNNAGVPGPVDPSATSAQDWDAVAAVNLRAAFLCSRAALEPMRASGGAIVNVASIAGQTGGMVMGPAYAASKAGLIGLTRSLARHFAKSAIRVNCISPADIETDMTSGWSEELRKRLLSVTPLGRFGEAEEVSKAAVFLASDEASFMTGQTISVNGGAYMG